MIDRAAAVPVRRKVKRAEGLLREAARDLAALAGDDPVLGVVRAQDKETQESACALIALGRAQYGAVDVIVVPRGRRTPTKAPEGAKENEHADSQGDPAPPRPVAA